jgi:hypothetical protein
MSHAASALPGDVAQIEADEHEGQPEPAAWDGPELAQMALTEVFTR